MAHYLMASVGVLAPYLQLGDEAKGRPAPNPSALPAGTSYGCAFSPDGSRLAVAHNGSPFITIYNTADWSKLPNPSVLPTGTFGYGCAFSPDGSRLAMTHNGSPVVTIYNTADWTKLPNPSVLPTSTGNGCAFSPDGSRLVVGHNGSPYITIYNTADWTKLPNPSALPAGTSYGCAFSPDGSRLAVAHNGSPYITIYNTADWTSRPASLFALGEQKYVAFSAIGKLVVRGSVRDIDNNPAARRVRVHERSTGDLCAETASSAVTGEYEAAVYQGDVDYDVQFLTADGEQLNDLFFARTRAGTP